MALKPLSAGSRCSTPQPREFPQSVPPAHPVQRVAAWLAVDVAIAPAFVLLLGGQTGGVDAVDATMARPPGPPPAALAAPARLACPAPQATTVVEGNDNGYYVVVDEVGNEAGSGSAIRPVSGPDDFGVLVQGRAAAGTITVSVALDNRTAAAVRFPGGLAVSVPITKDGMAWRTLQLTDPAVTELAPGASVSLSATTEAEGPGQYVFAASVETQRGT
ncbi:MAG: hypothetical protein ACRDKW_02915 [Actinomycetota bacterium]